VLAVCFVKLTFVKHSLQSFVFGVLFISSSCVCVCARARLALQCALLRRVWISRFFFEKNLGFILGFFLVSIFLGGGVAEA
jgi:hypothetical protein